MTTSDEIGSNLTLRALPARVRAILAARAQAQHQSLNAYLIGLLTREAETPTMAEVLADIETIRKPTGLAGDDAVAAVRADREGRDRTWA